MKRRWAVLVMIAAVVLAGGSIAAAQSAAEFFPLADGNWWSYTGSGLELTMAVEATGAGEFLINTVINGFVVQREYYTYEGDDAIALRREFPQGSFALEPPQVFLKAPFAPGRQWTWEGRVAGQTARMTFVVLEPETVETPAGTFEALPVAVDGVVDGEEVHTMRWFASGVGMIREQAQVAQGEQVILIDLVLADYHVQ
ncbi:MAG: hypothetical protein BAA04_05520 [Firmicutes bacterium ZCTH02-B6]|nr:MAG: hypothetical protein BAA04_05520 [Firmicutes bacterium ZCTH02-B6]